MYSFRAADFGNSISSLLIHSTFLIDYSKTLSPFFHSQISLFAFPFFKKLRRLYTEITKGECKSKMKIENNSANLLPGDKTKSESKQQEEFTRRNMPKILCQQKKTNLTWPNFVRVIVQYFLLLRITFTLVPPYSETYEPNYLDHE